VQLAACVDMSVELSDAALNYVRTAIESAAAKAQVRSCSCTAITVSLLPTVAS